LPGEWPRAESGANKNLAVNKSEWMTQQFLTQSRRVFRSNSELLQENATKSKPKKASQASRFIYGQVLSRRYKKVACNVCFRTDGEAIQAHDVGRHPTSSRMDACSSRLDNAKTLSSLFLTFQSKVGQANFLRCAATENSGNSPWGNQRAANVPLCRVIHRAPPTLHLCLFDYESVDAAFL